MDSQQSAKKDHLLLACGLALLAGAMAGVLRLVPNTYGFTAVGALGLFVGAKFRSWQSWGLPLLVMVVTDCLLLVMTADALYSPLHLSRTYVYGSLLVYVLLGKVLARRNTWPAVVGASLLGSLQFFVLTNFCYWLLQPLEGVDLYTRDASGLLNCFVMALPFYRAGFLGDLLFTGVLFGSYAWLTRPAVAPEACRAPA
jgi:hypothetical protein